MAEEKTGFSLVNAEILQHNWGWFLALGIALMVLGIMAIGVPIIASFTITSVVGSLFIAGGVLLTVHAFRARRWGRSLYELIGGLLYILFGILLLVYPMPGVFTLTVLLGGFFLVQGVVKILQALRMRPTANWGWGVFSGIVSLVLGLVLWVGLPSTAFWAIGLIVGIDLMLGGFYLVMISYAAHSAHREAWRCVGDECYSR